ncbi:MAG: hypothetical protein ACTTJL_09345, partial [Hoylesella enoeca]
STTFHANTITDITANLTPTIYPGNNEFYQWDAKQNYWYGHLDSDGQPDYILPNDPDRVYSQVLGYSDPTGAAPAVTASNTAAGCPNINELCWYIQDGDPHWDDQTLWSIVGHLYKGGMWLKKKDYISGYSTTAAPDGINYTRSTTFNYSTYSKSNILGKPTASDLSKYFYLPAIGFYTSTLIQVGNRGKYWSSTPLSFSTDGSYALGFGNGWVSVDNDGRDGGYRLWTAQ